MNKIYLRVSTDDLGQEFDRQVYILENAGYVMSECIVYQEKVSGKSTKKRNELKRMLSELEVDDVVVVADLSRLARSVKDLWEISDEIVRCKSTLISIKENIDLANPSGRLVFSILGAINEFERDILSQRTKDGLAAKKKSGIRLGRPTVIESEVITNAVNTYLTSKLSYEKVGKLFGISGVTVYNEVKKYKNKGEEK